METSCGRRRGSAQAQAPPRRRQTPLRGGTRAPQLPSPSSAAGPGALARPARLMLSRCGPGSLPPPGPVSPAGLAAGESGSDTLRWNRYQAPGPLSPPRPSRFPVQAIKSELGRADCVETLLAAPPALPQPRPPGHASSGPRPQWYAPDAPLRNPALGPAPTAPPPPRGPAPAAPRPRLRHQPLWAARCASRSVRLCVSGCLWLSTFLCVSPIPGTSLSLQPPVSVSPSP